ncbi:MAG: DNA mismatch repair endonuclease MutL [Clostridia bacterium]|nr:DNA mismatch repair endonuclease MutL [Clostridia bacterium]
MGKINKLDISVANLIAAGEVVDRPSSALKELIENAVDSGADKITVEIRRGGVALMRVTDNGCGMTKEDISVAVLRHATSKIKNASDLESILTLGFRGEALAAISAVADIRILSRTEDAEDGALLEARAGSVPTVTDVGCAVGTTVIAENIFSNLPARQKFLKSDRTEAMSCHAVAEKLALSHPEVSFTFISDGVERFSTAGDGIRYNVLYSVFGREFADKLIPVNGENGAIKVDGFVGNSLNNRANRGLQHFFINGRFVRCRTAQAALEEAFSSYMAEGKFPVCALWITIPANSVDVNVHPAKLEVKFSNEKPIFEAVYYAVRYALQNDTNKAQMKLKTESPFRFTATESKIPAGRDKESYKAPTLLDSVKEALAEVKRTSALPSYSFIPPSPPIDAVEEYAPPKPTNFTDLASPISADFYSSFEKYSEPPKPKVDEAVKVDFGKKDEEPSLVYDNSAEEKSEAPLKDEKPIIPIEYIGIVFDTYVLAKREDELLIIDKHAAHERVIYEEMMRNLKADSEPPKLMLVPIELRLPQDQLAALLEYEENVKNAGFDFTVENGEVLIDQIPGFLTVDSARDLIEELVGSIAEGEGRSAVITRDTLFSKSLYSASCKAAMKGGVRDSEEHIRWLLSELSRCDDIKVCPHGRPVVTVLSHSYLDRAFGRLL